MKMVENILMAFTVKLFATSRNSIRSFAHYHPIDMIFLRYVCKTSFALKKLVNCGVRMGTFVVLRDRIDNISFVLFHPCSTFYHHRELYRNLTRDRIKVVPQSREFPVESYRTTEHNLWHAHWQGLYELTLLVENQLESQRQ